VTPTSALALLIVAGEWTGLARGLLGAPIYAGVLDVVLVGLAAFAGYRHLRAGGGWHLPLLGVLILAYMALSVLEVFNPNVAGIVVGLEGFRKSAFTMVAFFVVFLSQSGRPETFYRIVVIGSMPAFVWAIRQFFSPMPAELNIIGTAGTSLITFHSGSVLRAFAPTAGPFHLGLLAAFVMLIATALSRDGSRWWLAAVTISAVTLALTITRANIAAGLIGLVVILVLSPREARPRALRGAGLAAVGVVAAVLFAVGAFALPLVHVPVSAARLETASPSPSHIALPSPTKDTLGDVVNGVINPLNDTSLKFRFGYWKTYLQAIAEDPLVGYGTSAAADGFDRDYAGTGKRNFEPHSMYLKPALEMGFLGFGLFIAIAVVALVGAIRLHRMANGFALISIAIFVALAITGLTGPMLDAYPVNLLVWATVGWVAVSRTRLGRPLSA
jgi:O-antigen ligase